MESIALAKNALSITKKMLAFMNRRSGKIKKDRRTREDRKKRKEAFNRRLTLVIAMIFAGVCLFALSPASGGQSKTHTTQQPDVSSTARKELTWYNAVVNEANKGTTLRASGSAMLTMYPDSDTPALSSLTVDEKIGNQHYTRYTGKGSSIPPPNLENPKNLPKQQPQPEKCPEHLPDAATGYINNGDLTSTTDACLDNPNDAFISSTGILFSIPEYLTTSSPSIISITGIIQGVALLFLTPIIVLIGFSFMSKFGNVSYADALSSLPRLILSLIGVAGCLLLAEQVIQFGNVMTLGLWATFSGLGLNTKEMAITNVLIAASSWDGWLHHLLGLGVALLVAQSVAPLSIMGFNYGGFISLGINIGVGVTLIKESSEIIKLTLSMALGAEILIRILLIDVYVILSPLAMVALGLPGQAGAKFSQEWIYGFLSLIASQFTQVAVIGVALVVRAEYIAHASDDIIALFIVFSAITLALRVPSLFRSNATELLKQVGPLVASTVQHERSIFF